MQEQETGNAPLPDCKPDPLLGELEAERERYIRFFNASGDLLMVADSDGTIKLLNHSYAQTFGYALDELLGRNYLDLVHADDREATAAEFDVATRPRADEFVNRMLCRDGSLRWVAWHSVYLSEENAIYAAGHDVSAQRQAEEELRTASRYSRSLLEASLDPLVTISAQGKITDVNRATEEATGIAREALIGTDFSDYFTEPDKARSGYQLVFLQGSVSDYPLALRHASGKVTEVLYNARVYCDEAGRVAGVFAAARDVTALKQIERQLRASSHYARSLLEASPDPLVTISTEGKITNVNRATEEVTGMARLELVGRDFSDCFTDPGMARAGYQRVFASGQVSDYPLTIRHVSGRLTEVLYNASVYRDEQGRIAGVFAAARDVTRINAVTRDLARHREHLEELVEQRTRELEGAKQAAEAANRAKSAFLSNVSHELRTPMNAIVGMAYMLQQGRLDPAQQEQLDALQAASRQLLALIDDILNYTRIETGTLQTERSGFELAAVLDTVAGRIRDRAAAKGLALQIDLDPGLPQRLEGDAPQIGQVLHKLLDNAVKFTEAGAVGLAVRLVERGAAEALLQFDVSDTGIGIPAAEQAVLFESFKQLDDGPARRYGGTGLGLAIARRLVDLMGGSIGVESEPGRGSRFWFRLRLGLPAGATAPPDGAEPQAAGPGDQALSEAELGERWQALRPRLIGLLEQDDADCVPLFDANEALARAALGADFERTAAALHGFDFGAALQAISRG